MDANDMKLLNDIYIRMLKKGRSIYKIAEKENSLKNVQELESYSAYLGQMNDKIESILDITDKYANECLDKANEIRNYIDVNNKYKDDPMKMLLAHKEMYGGMSWADLTEMEEEKERVLKNIKKIVKNPAKKSEYEQTPILYKDVSNIYGKDIGFNCKIPIINKLNEMPSALYWYKGDQTNPEGIYTCLSRKFYIQVPFPNVIDGTKDFNRTCSIKCKYNTEQECLKIRKDLADRFNSELRDCKFAHIGDKYTKVGTLFRCPNIPRFGSHVFLDDDLENLPDYDMKMMLMYSLSDILLGALWFQKQKNNSMVLTNIDTC